MGARGNLLYNEHIYNELQQSEESHGLTHTLLEKKQRKKPFQNHFTGQQIPTPEPDIMRKEIIGSYPSWAQKETILNKILEIRMVIHEKVKTL